MNKAYKLYYAMRLRVFKAYKFVQVSWWRTVVDRTLVSADELSVSCAIFLCAAYAKAYLGDSTNEVSARFLPSASR